MIPHTATPDPASPELDARFRSRAMALMFAVLLIMMIGFSVLFPIMPYYLRTFGADAGVMGLLAGLYSFMQFLFSPIWGRLSDSKGRKPILMIGLAGFVVSQLLFGLATQLWMLFFARTMAGILSAAALPTAMAYIADITRPEDRAKGMGVLGAAFGLGVIIGPGFGGALSHVSLSLPFFASSALAAIALLGVFLYLPESLPRSSGAAPSPAKKTSRWGGFSRDMGALYAVTLMLSLGMAALEVTFGFFSADRLHLAADQTGWIFVVMGVVAVIVQGGLVGKLQKAFGEKKMMLGGRACATLGMLAMTSSDGVIAATIAISLIAAGSGLARPSNAALISRRARTGQGVAIGLMDSCDSLGRVVGPLIGGFLYLRGWTLPYAAGGALFFLTLLLAGIGIPATALDTPPRTAS